MYWISLSNNENYRNKGTVHKIKEINDVENYFIYIDKTNGEKKGMLDIIGKEFREAEANELEIVTAKLLGKCYG